MSRPPVSFVCPVTCYGHDLVRMHREFRRVVERSGRTCEFIYVVDGPGCHLDDELAEIQSAGGLVRVLQLSKLFGEATALQVGIDESRGDFVLTIPDRPQIDPEVTDEILVLLERGEQVVVTRRDPRSDPWLNRLQSRIFHGLIRQLVGHDFRDMACGLRGLSADAARKLDLYGDQHRFIPVIAVRLGYAVTELPGRQHEANRRLRLYAGGVYVRRLLDILNVFFLTRFTRKPLRFFGLIGLTVGMLGAAICAVLGMQRLLGMTALADRPLLLLGVLMVVLGVQITSMGLLGEIIIFLAAQRESPRFIEHRPHREREDPPGPALRTSVG